MVYIISIIIGASIIILTMGNKIGERGTQKIIDRGYIIIYIYIIYYINKIIKGGEERTIGIRIWNKEISRGEEIGIIIDRTTIIMVGLIIIIGHIIIKYSSWYIGEAKFIGLLNIFIGSMIIIVSTKNIIGIYMGWEWVGICSYMLINYWYRNNKNNKSGIKAIVYNKIGDIGIIIVIVIMNNIYNISNNNIIIYNTNKIITIGIIMGAIGKSAQYIMHPWLGDAMAGPTPVSALLHAATMVTAGVILLIRTMIYKDIMWEMVLYISLITIVFGGLTSLVQNDIKKLIAYSTCSQVGYMFILLYNETPVILSLYHLFTHAFFKALIFICAGIIIHYSQNEQDLRRLHINSTNFLYPYIFFSSLSLFSFPYTSGYYSKEAIILSTDNYYVFTLLLIGALLTVLYTYKLLYLVYINNNNVSPSFSPFPFSLSLSLLPLIIGSVFLGYIANGYYVSQWNYIIKHNVYMYSMPIIAWLIYKYIDSNIYIIKNVWYHIYLLLNNRSYIDDIINNISYDILVLSYSIYKYLDKGIIEYIGPSGIYRYMNRYNIYRMSIYSKNSIILLIIIIIIMVYITIEQ